MRIYSLEMVTRRFIPLVVAFATAFAPVALEACQVTCLSHSVESIAAGSARHHHAHSAPAATMPTAHVHHHPAALPEMPSSTVVIASQPHPCDHGDDLPTVAGALNNVVVTPAVAASVLLLPEIHPRFVRVRDAAAASSSERIPLATQLRV